MPLGENQRYLVVLRSEKKKILYSQLFLAQYLLKLVKKCIQLRDLALADKEAAVEQFKEAYLELMDDESENRDEAAERRYQYRRFFMKDYLKQLQQLVINGKL